MNLNKYEKATIYFDEKEVHLADGKIVPILKMWGKNGNLTEISSEVVMVSAGGGVNLRLLD